MSKPEFTNEQQEQIDRVVMTVLEHLDHMLIKSPEPPSGTPDALAQVVMAMTASPHAPAFIVEHMSLKAYRGE